MSFKQYIFNQGKKLEGEQVEDTVFRKYESILPKRVLSMWKEGGFSGFSNGLIWLTNPDLYNNFRDEWRKANDILSLDNKKVYIVARSSFGDLLFYVIEDDGDNYFAILDIIYNKYEVLGDSELDFFFDILLDDKSFVEYHFSEKLFNQCLEKLGLLEEDECYGFSPLPALGGDKSVEYAQKVKLKEYLSICAQSAML